MKENLDKLLGYDKFPVTPKDRHDSLCQQVSEVKANEKFLLGRLKKEVEANMKEYEDYAKADHSDIGSHFHAFPPMYLGGNYTGHIGMRWPSSKVSLRYAISKKFMLKDGTSDLTVCKIVPEYGDKPSFAFFTDDFMFDLNYMSHVNTSLFFLDSTTTGYITYSDYEVRWLSIDGLACGYKHCFFSVFHTLNRQYRFQTGKNMSEDDLEVLDKRIWYEMEALPTKQQAENENFKTVSDEEE